MNDIIKIKEILKAAFERFYYEGSKDAIWQKETLAIIASKATTLRAPLDIPDVQEFLREWERQGFLRITDGFEIQVLKPGMSL